MVLKSIQPPNLQIDSHQTRSHPQHTREHLESKKTCLCPKAVIRDTLPAVRSFTISSETFHLSNPKHFPRSYYSLSDQSRQSLLLKESKAIEAIRPEVTPRRKKVSHHSHSTRGNQLCQWSIDSSLSTIRISIAKFLTTYFHRSATRLSGVKRTGQDGFTKITSAIVQSLQRQRNQEYSPAKRWHVSCTRVRAAIRWSILLLQPETTDS